MIGVIDGDKSVYVRCLSRTKFVQLQLAFVVGQRAQIIAHQSWRWQAEIDKLYSGDGGYNFRGRFHNPRFARVLVEGNSSNWCGYAQQWPEHLEF